MSEERASAPREAAELLELIDRLEALLDRTDLTEIEVEAGGTGLILRTPAAIADQQVVVAQSGAAAGAGAGAAVDRPGQGGDDAQTASDRRAVLAPLTGLFYASPSPGAEPYVRPGGDVQVGQVIGLIEAMKLFNEIKSDASGKIARICVENGALVKAKQPLIEVEPA
ncbi:MAG TPA: biotin/lipoyl-containing protein [Candidatus Limnocylindrales bacterium]|nr:biotin/lipoyl-containing protein [Candidatus Limnocylindrales bacterium]